LAENPHLTEQKNIKNIFPDFGLSPDEGAYPVPFHAPAPIRVRSFARFYTARRIRL
jgi:hypothetical protein